MTDFHHLVCGWSTLQGRRPYNEDALVTLPERGIFGVCDGIGGLADGAAASRLVAATIEQSFRDTRIPSALEVMAYRVLAVSAAVRRAAEDMRRQTLDRGLKGMGSTVAVLVTPAYGEAHRAAVLHAGDSLVFRLRRNCIERLCEPHTVAAHYGDAAARLPAHLQRAITRAVDHRADSRMDIAYTDLAPGDWVVLCTDGVTGALDLEALGQTLYDCTKDGPQAAAEELTRAALQAGSLDNASAVVVEVRDT
jgi:serine/threonine protein phosphatase PrpC